MNKNIFSPKGMIDECFFIIYYIILIAMYIILGALILIYVYKNNLNSTYYVLPFLLLKLLIMFNYKKRLRHIGLNLPLSIVGGLILAFDTECVVACSLIKDIAASMILFWVLLIFFIIIQPAILTLIPGKNAAKPDNQ